MDWKRRWRLEVNLKTIFIGIIALYIFTFVLVLPNKCKSLGYSFYFVDDDAEGEVDRQNHVRLRQSLDYLKNYRRVDGGMSKGRERRGKPICTSILTIKRVVENGYLVQTVAKLVKESINSSLDFDLKIVNADVMPEDNKQYLKLKEFHTGTELASYDRKMQQFLLEMDGYEKHRYDMIEALRICDFKDKYDYALVLEDDAFAGYDFANMLHYVIGSLPKDNSFGYIKLYHPEKWQGFGYDTKLEVFLIAVISFFGFSGIGIILVNANHVTIKKLVASLLIILLLVGYVLAFCYVFSRQHLLEIFKFWRHTHFIIDATGCCTSAVLYPTNVLSEFIHFLETEVTCNVSYPIDLAPYDYFERLGLDRLQVIPNMFFHIGYFSGVSSAKKSPKNFFHLFPAQF